MVPFPPLCVMEAKEARKLILAPYQECRLVLSYYCARQSGPDGGSTMRVCGPKALAAQPPQVSSAWYRDSLSTISPPLIKWGKWAMKDKCHVIHQICYWICLQLGWTAQKLNPVESHSRQAQGALWIGGLSSNFMSSVTLSSATFHKASLRVIVG